MIQKMSKILMLSYCSNTVESGINLGDKKVSKKMLKKSVKKSVKIWCQKSVKKNVKIWCQKMSKIWCQKMSNFDCRNLSSVIFKGAKIYGKMYVQNVSKVWHNICNVMI